MDVRDAILLLVQEEDGEIVGPPLLQKKGYFASVIAGEDFFFRPHYYGPYSQTVADAVDSLVGNGFVRETVETFPEEANAFGERRRHSYALRDDGRQIIESVLKRPGAKKWQQALKRINSHPVGKDFNLLSIAAKIHVILKVLGKAQETEIRGPYPSLKGALGMPTPYAYLRKQFVPLAEAKIGVMTHALNYGTGCFEGIRGNWNGGQEKTYPFRLRDHFPRLPASCRLLLLALPP